MNKFMTFDKMITPTIIKIIFWVGVAFSVLTGLIMMIAGSSEGEGLVTFAGFIFIFIGSLMTRVYCELLIIFFKMHESLNEIKNELAKQKDTPA